ncbi:MAG TPA: peptidylprolyl isomerase [Hyphomicrobium sp.]|nr:peptidylprolyl isomerase [Hyphomicrobium sp.]
MDFPNRTFPILGLSGLCAIVLAAPLALPADAQMVMRGPNNEGAPPAKVAQAKKKPSPGKSINTEQSIVALVNDEPITGYEVRQRAEMLAGGSVGEYVKNNVEARWKQIITGKKIQEEFQEYAKKRQPRSKEDLQKIQKDFVIAKRNAMLAQLQAEARAKTSGKSSKVALDELIDEKLKMQEAKRVGAVASASEVDAVIKSIAERNKLTIEQLAKNLGGSLEPMKQRIGSTLAWNDVVRRKFGHQISIASRDVDKYVASAEGGEDQVELQVQRISINMPAQMEHGGVAQRVSQAEAIRARFTGCKDISKLVAGQAGVRHEDLGKRKASSFPEPTRSLLLNAKDNEMLPPSVTEDGIDIFAVCGRDVVKAEEARRTQAEGELKQKEFDLLAKRYLKDLRQDAHIEYR